MSVKNKHFSDHFKWKLVISAFPAVSLFVILYAVVLTSKNERVDCVFLKSFHWSILACGAVCTALLQKPGSFFKAMDAIILPGWSIFTLVEEIFKRGYSNESYWAVLSRGAVYYAVQGGSKLLSLWIKSYEVTIQMKATELYFPVVLFIMLYKVVLNFESVDEVLKCNHTNESHWAVLSYATVYYAVQGGSKFWVCERNH